MIWLGLLIVILAVLFFIGIFIFMISVDDRFGGPGSIIFGLCLSLSSLIILLIGGYTNKVKITVLNTSTSFRQESIDWSVFDKEAVNLNEKMKRSVPPDTIINKTKLTNVWFGGLFSGFDYIDYRVSETKESEKHD